MGAASLVFVTSFPIWPLLMLNDQFYWATWPLLIGVHVIMGVATAGVALAMGNLALKAAPKGEATAYLATNALVTGIAASISPILAGVIGDFFQGRSLTVDMTWTQPTLPEGFNIPAFDIAGLDFLFIIAFVVGLIALQDLGPIEERGEVDEKVVLTELRHALRKSVFSLVGPAGVSRLVAIPTGKALSTARRNNQMAKGESQPPPPPAEL